MPHVHNKTGFTLAELLAVMAILAILAAVSAPFLRNYMLDSANDKAKSTMHIIAQGHKNFLADYPASSIIPAQITNPPPTVIACFEVDRTAANPIDVLFTCNYIQNITLNQPYDFFVGSCPGLVAPPIHNPIMACMQGTATRRYCPAYFAWVDRFGDIHDNMEDSGCPP